MQMAHDFSKDEFYQRLETSPLLKAHRKLAPSKHWYVQSQCFFHSANASAARIYNVVCRYMAGDSFKKAKLKARQRVAEFRTGVFLLTNKQVRI